MSSFTALHSIVDQTIPMIWAAEAYCFECEDVNAALRALQKGLDITVSQLPFLAGEVYEDPQNRNCTISEWSEGRSRILIDEIDGSRLPSTKELKKLRMPLHTLDCGSLFPPTTKRLTKKGRQVAYAASYARIDGGMILSCVAHHTLMDGFGIQHVWRKWAYYTTNIGLDIDIGPREPLSRYERLNRAVKLAHGDGMPEKAFQKVLQNGHSKSDQAHNNVSNPTKEYSNLPPPKLSAAAKIFVLSAIKLNQLSERIRDHVSQPFSLNTLITALLWQSISVIRRKRIEKEVDLSGQDPVSELMLMVDCRKLLENVLPGSRNWLGNLTLPLLPEPRFALKAFSNAVIDLQEVQRNCESIKGSRGLKCHQSLPYLINRLASIYSNFSVTHVSESLSSMLDDVSFPGFDFRTLRSRTMTLNGLHLVVTNVLNFDPYHDFGPHLGRPAFVRPLGDGIDGLCIVFPQKRGEGWTAQERDEIEIQVYLREDDMDELVKCEVLQQMWCANPV